jgi:23S rRNA (cytosine1962-C5)-methyltransferase
VTTGSQELRLKVAQAAKRRRPPPNTTAYRVVNAEGDGLPGITVDWFDRVAVLALYREASPAEEKALADALIALGARSVYLKRRPREARVAAGTRREELAPERPLRGEPVSELEVTEAGLRFLIRPGQGLSVGLYLDARDARGWVRQNAGGARVLNCFAYTCGFGLAALVGGAARAVNVDVSRRVLDWGEANLRLNGLVPERRDFLAGDTFDELARFARRGEQFDLVVLDPPAFARTRKSPV